MKENKQFKVLIVLFIVSAIILLAGLTGRGITLKVIGDVIFIKPISIALTGLRKIGTGATNLVALTKEKINLEQENSNLKENISYLQEQIKLLEGMEAENQTLKAALGINASQPDWGLEVANVIGYSSLTNMMIIDKGQADGIKKDMPVVYSLDGKTIELVGIVSETGAKVSQVQLSINTNFKVGVKNIVKGGIEIAEGNGENVTIDSYSRNVNIEIGDIYSTTDISNIYPPNIIVGEVQEITNKSNVERIVVLNPTIPFDKLLNVFILTSNE